MAKVKNKKTNSAEAAVQKRKRETKKVLNPFEVHINKDKQKVLGRKNKADRGLPGVARAKAISKRKGTLLQEYKTRDKDNVFADRRIGEKNASMTQEERAMARFAAERVKSHQKKNIFSLNDEEVLTHRGQTLEEIEKFEDPKSDEDFSDDERQSGHLDKKFVGEAHFGGGVLSKSDGSLSRKDLIAQLIFESKKRKAEKQKIREQTTDLTEKLDTEWKDLLPLMASSKKTDADPVEKVKADDYDIAVRELKFESRGTPSDRLKSEEEVMREEKEKLEALEEDRLARMKGFAKDLDDRTKHKSADDLDDDFQVEDIDEETLAYDEEGRIKGQTKNLDDDKGSSSVVEDSEKVSWNDENDDEEENLNRDTKTMTHQGKSQISNGHHSPTELEAESSVEEDSDDEDEADNDEDDLSDLKQSESSSEDEESSKNMANSVHSSKTKPKNTKNDDTVIIAKVNAKTEDSTDAEKVKKIRDDLQRRKEIMEKARQELPYTYSAPETFEEFEKLLEKQSPDYQSIILERIVKCNHWTLGQGNREKLCTVFDHLLRYIVHSANVTTEEEIFKCFQIFDR